MKKDQKKYAIITIFILLMLGIIIFIYPRIEKGFKCPDEWYSNEMPSVGFSDNSEYFMWGDRQVNVDDLTLEDKVWIEKNCNLTATKTL